MKRRNITKASQERAILNPSKRVQETPREKDKDCYDNGKTKNDKPLASSSQPPSSSYLAFYLLWMIPLFIFVGFPLLIFGWYMIQNSLHMEREMGLAIVITLVVGAVIALLSHLSSEGFLQLLRNFKSKNDKIIQDRGDQQRIREKDHASIKEEVEVEEEWIQPKVRLWNGDGDVKDGILNETQRQLLAEQVLPRTLADHYWRSLYSLSRDGDIFEVCLRRLEDERRTLIIIRTSRGETLGGFVDAMWKSKARGIIQNTEGGSGACVFGFRKDNGNSLEVYKWTGSNRYSQLVDVERQKIAMGAGDFESNSYAWSVERNFTVGTTGRCPTFDNEPLCDQERFDVVDLDVYGFCVG